MREEALIVRCSVTCFSHFVPLCSKPRALLPRLPVCWCLSPQVARCIATW
jgi:hypothetical protein